MGYGIENGQLRRFRNAPAPLTDREREAVIDAARGSSRLQTARRLSIKEATVKSHRRNTQLRLEATRARGTVLGAIKLGNVTLNEVAHDENGRLNYKWDKRKPLSNRQFEALSLLTEHPDWKVKQIATHMVIELTSAKFHLRKVYENLNLSKGTSLSGHHDVQAAVIFLIAAVAGINLKERPLNDSRRVMDAIGLHPMVHFPIRNTEETEEAIEQIEAGGVGVLSVLQPPSQTGSLRRQTEIDLDTPTYVQIIFSAQSIASMLGRYDIPPSLIDLFRDDEHKPRLLQGKDDQMYALVYVDKDSLSDPNSKTAKKLDLLKAQLNQRMQPY